MNTLKKRILFPLVAILVCCTLTACGVIQLLGNSSSEDSHITLVKGGSPFAYPDRTYGEAFDAFFDSPSWTYFEGTDDYGESQDIVEFTGKCIYQDVEVEVCLQFILDMDNGSFETSYLSFNDVPQNILMLAGLMEAVFANEDLNTVASSSDDDSYPYLLEFAELCCSDPSALYSDDEDEYNAFIQSVKQSYDEWVAGTDYRYIIIDSTGHLAIDYDVAEAEGIVGLW